MPTHCGACGDDLVAIPALDLLMGGEGVERHSIGSTLALIKRVVESVGRERAKDD